MNIWKKFKVAIYLRLSREDDDFKEESASITNQRNFLMNFVRANDNFLFIDEYIDDGFSGGDFERPNFKRLMYDIQTGKIDCIIVKDQSRFGRNDLVPYYIRQYFPMMGVRFIAVNSDIDTFDKNKSGNKMVGFYSAMNAHYCYDTSEKVKSAIITEKKEGKHLGGVAPYGYKKDPNDKYKLLIDEETAPVVRTMFEMFARGNSLQMIARHLDSKKIPIPSVKKNLNRGLKSSMYGHWQTRTIDEILKSEMYIGNMCQNRRQRVAVNVKKLVRTPKDEWIIVKNTHEPIIDKDTFDIVQNIYSKNSHMTRNTSNYLFKGFIYCKECGHTIGINTTRGKGHLVCNYYRKYSKENACTPHRMKYDDLEKAILKEIKSYFKKCTSKKMIDNLKKNDKTEKLIRTLENEINTLEMEIEKLQAKDEETYDDRLNGMISLKTYASARNRILERQELNKNKIEENKLRIEQLKGNGLNKDFEKIAKDYLSLKKPNRKILSNIIDRIVIDENLNIEIYYKFRKPI